jgi:hypothetical protein
VTDVLTAAEALAVVLTDDLPAAPSIYCREVGPPCPFANNVRAVSDQPRSGSGRQRAHDEVLVRQRNQRNEPTESGPLAFPLTPVLPRGTMAIADS